MHSQALALAFILPLIYAQSGGPQFQNGYADRQLPLEQDSDLVSANFPDVEGIELLSPAFLNPENVPEGFSNGTSTATPLLTQDTFLRTLAGRNDWLTYYQGDFTSEEARAIPYLYLTNDAKPSDASHKIRIFLQGHIHGNEPAGEEGILALLGKMDANATYAQSILEAVDIMIVPRNNPDGVAYFQRQLASGFDPNRDWVILGRQPTRDIKSLYSSFSPHIFVDCHEYTASTLLGPDSDLLKSEDGQILGMTNLNIHQDILELQNGLFLEAMAESLESRNLRTGSYYTAAAGEELYLTQPDSNSQYAGSAAGLYQTVSLLTETRGIRLGDQHFQRRTASTLFLLEGIIQTAVNNAQDVYEIIEGARADFIANDNPVVVTDSRREENVTWEFIDANTGDLVTRDAVFLNNTPPDANITRARPEAYVFSRAWADVAERLRISGVHVETLDADFTGIVEALTIDAATLADARFEGVAQLSVTATTANRREVSIPAGGFWVSTRQLNAAFAMVLLEPENISSAATYNIVPVDEEDEWPIFRVMKEDC
ncbi:hypothetical protein MBLNU230_g6275t1 [Neophaeotheca triangularis]